MSTSSGVREHPSDSDDLLLSPHREAGIPGESGLLIGLINRAAADHGSEDAGFGELRGGNFGEVVR